MTPTITSCVLLGVCLASVVSGQTTQSVNLFGDDKIRLVVRADDFGFSHASNMALAKILGEGTLTAASVIVNTGWLDETVEILKKHPQVSVGVHVCLNAEWTPYRWGPVLPAKDVPSLVDDWGYFFGTRNDLINHQPDMDQVEREIRAQVQLAMRKGLRISYMDHHMGTAVTTPQMRERFVKVAREYGLGISRWFGEIPRPVVYSVEPAKKLDFVVSELEKLRPGLYLMVCHTAIKSPEVEVLKDLNVTGLKNMADYRQAECDMLCSPRLKQVIKERGIELVGYDTLREKFVAKMQQPAE
jgi:predicted glycoside hydrolase/deacetylase ChbG (UPF0249 family)